MTPAAFATEVAGAFTQAAQIAGLVQYDHQLAGRPLHLRFAGSELADRLAPAFAHLPRGGVGDGLFIDAWDRMSTGVPAPRPPWAISDFLPRERIRGFDNVRYDIGNGLLSVDRREGGLLHALDAALVPRWVVRMPFRHLLGSWATREKLALVHAAAVGVDGVCLLLPGTSGSGKSTTALTAAAHGLDFLADDLCLLDPSGPTAYAPYALAKLEEDAFERLPSLRDSVLSTEDGQSMIAPPGLRTSSRLVGIAIPHVAGTVRTSWSRSTARAALHAMAPSTLIEGNGGSAATMQLMRELGEVLPCFDLALGTDPVGVAETLRELVAACR
ncbi:hypothetical protein BH10ACT2_BH10ACT2_24790 [soil metagenome]